MSEFPTGTGLTAEQLALATLDPVFFAITDTVSSFLDTCPEVEGFDITCGDTKLNLGRTMCTMPVTVGGVEYSVIIHRVTPGAVDT